MFTDRTKRWTRRALSALTAVGLALGLSTGLQAQERQEMAEEEQAEITADELREAVSEADVELDELGGLEDLKVTDVVVIDAEHIVESGQQLAMLRREHGEVISTYQTGLEGNAAIEEALQEQDLDLGAVLSVYVTDADRSLAAKVAQAKKPGKAEEAHEAEKPKEGEKAEKAVAETKRKKVYVLVSD